MMMIDHDHDSFGAEHSVLLAKWMIFKFPASCRWSQCIDWISQMHEIDYYAPAVTAASLIGRDSATLIRHFSSAHSLNLLPPMPAAKIQIDLK